MKVSCKPGNSFNFTYIYNSTHIIWVICTWLCPSIMTNDYYVAGEKESCICPSTSRLSKPISTSEKPAFFFGTGCSCFWPADICGWYWSADICCWYCSVDIFSSLGKFSGTRGDFWGFMISVAQFWSAGSSSKFTANRGTISVLGQKYCPKPIGKK